MVFCKCLVFCEIYCINFGGKIFLIQTYALCSACICLEFFFCKILLDLLARLLRAKTCAQIAAVVMLHFGITKLKLDISMLLQFSVPGLCVE